MMRRVAPKYGLACLLHEKPFAGVNGSGKHLNWSMSDDLGNNLLNPGDTPHDNVQFLVFCAAVLRAVNKFQGLLRFAHRQRRQRSSPRRQRSAAGDHLDLPRRHADRHLRADRKGRQRQDHQAGGIMDIGVVVLPKLPRDAGDRNRTSPFAFTGNKFEFRAVVGRTRASPARTSRSTSRSPSRSITSRPSSRRQLKERQEARRPRSRRCSPR